MQSGFARSFEELKSHLETFEQVGKGWRGYVFRAKFGDLDLAIKVARSKEVLDFVKREVRALSMLSGLEGFPQMRFYGTDFVAYDFIRGEIFKRANLSKEKKLEVFIKVLELIQVLDSLGIDKGEMNKLDKNLLVSEDGIYLIDFESSRFDVKTHNLSRFLQLLLSHGVLSRELAKELGIAYRRGEKWVFKEVKNVLDRAIRELA
ncbi:MAG: serine/threonine protein kinase [Aquificaceae bacterium]